MGNTKEEQGELNCGCKVISGILCGNTIEYCPLHKSAPELYEALEETLIFTKQDDRVHFKVEQALAKAEGGK